MKKLHQQYLLFSIIAFLLLLIYLFRPNLWQERIDTYLNGQLGKEGWSLNNSAFSGHLFTEISSKDIILTNKDGTSVLFPSIDARIKIIPLMMGKIKLNELSVSNAVIKPSFSFQNDSSNNLTFQFDPNKIPININNLNIDGDLYIPYEDTTRSINFLIDGGIANDDEKITIDLNQLNFSSLLPSFNIRTKGVKGSIDKNKISIDLNEASVNEIGIAGSFEYDFIDSSRIYAEIELNDYKLPESIFSEFPLKPNLSSLSADFIFESNFTDYEGRLKIKNDLGLNMVGNFELKSDTGFVRLNTLQLQGNDANLSLNGLVEDQGRFNGIIKLDNLDFSQWVVDSRKTAISGYLLIDGHFENMLITSLDLNADVSESLIFDGEPSSLSGGIAYSDSLLTIFNPVTLSIGSSIVAIQGRANYKTELMNLDLSLTEASSALINNFWSDTLSNGSATGSMSIGGSFDTISVDADLIINDFAYKNIQLSKFELFAKLEDLNNFDNGTIRTKFEDGQWNEFIFESGNGQFTLDNDIVKISSLELRNNKDFLQINGFLEGDSLLVLDQLQFAYQDHYLINPSQLKIKFLNNSVHIEPFEIHVDDGIVKGYFNTNPFVGKVRFSNVTTDLFPLLKIKGSEKIKGNLFGEIFFPKDTKREQVKFDFSIKDGSYINQSFDDLYVDAFYQNGMLSIDSLSLSDGEESNFKIKGKFPFPLDHKTAQQTFLESEYKNIDLSLISDFSHNQLSRIKGQYSGIFTVKGNTLKTQYYLDGKIVNAFWGRLPLGLVRGKGSYKNKRLIFENFYSDWNQNHIEGKASIPIDIDIVSKSREISPKSTLDLESSGYFRSAEFLSSYISQVDSIVGEIEIDFNIGGSVKKLIRNGSIYIEEGSIYTVLMDEPINLISAKAELKSNFMDITSFNGSINDSQSKIKNKDNFLMDGKIDFTKFFEPRYNVTANGKDIFYRSLNQDIESYADIDISIIGKDTIDISGTINARNGAIYKEFTSSESNDASNDSERTITNYNIRFPIEDSFSIRNSQIDAKISGELGMSKLYSETWNYSGEIEFIEGQIYYYLGDVFENLKGTMVFDGQGFNPFLELSASTKIGDAEIILGVFGPFDNPEWRFDSDKGYSESDILQLLTFNTRVSEEGFSTEGLGTQAQTILGAYLERQLEKNFIKSTGLKSSGIIQDVQISGTSELINPNQGEEFSINARLNQSFSLSYKRSFSLEAAYKNKVGVEYKLNPNFSVIGNVDESGQVQMKFRVRRVY